MTKRFITVAQPKNLTQRSDQTVTALIESGLTLFSEYGFNATTTRMLCKHAGTNVSSIPYHFGNKKGLYHEVVRHILHCAKQQTLEPLSNIRTQLSHGMTQAQALVALKQLIQALAGVFVDSEEARRWTQILIREQSNPTEAFDILYHGHIQEMQQVIAGLVGICLNLGAETEEVKIRSHALFGQLLGFCISRESILRSLGTRQLSSEQKQIIYQALQAHTEACVTPKPTGEESALAI